jgi:hypothetical protein
MIKHQREKLTRRFFYSQPEGTYVVSNRFSSPGVSVFSEAVAARSGRLAQWQKIVRANAHGRICDVFRNKAGFLRSDLARQLLEAEKVGKKGIRVLAELRKVHATCLAMRQGRPFDVDWLFN